MWLRVLAELGQADLGDLARKQHAAGLAANRAGAYHAVSQGEVILGLKELVDELLHVRVLGHHALEYLALSLVAEAAPAELQLGHGEEAVVAVEILVLGVGRDVVEQLVVAAERHAAVQWAEGAAAAADVREIDVHRVAPHGLERVDIHRAVAHVDVYEHLGRVPDAGRSLKGVAPADYREVRHGVELIQIRAGHAEEVAHHLVRVPGDLQLGEAVEDVEGALPFFGYAVIYVHGEGLEAEHGVEFVHLQARLRTEHALVPGVVHVDEVAPVLERLLGKRLRKKPVFIQCRDLPNDVVAHADIVKHLIHAGVAARYSLKRHSLRLLRIFFLLFYYTADRNSSHFLHFSCEPSVKSPSRRPCV